MKRIAFIGDQNFFKQLQMAVFSDYYVKLFRETLHYYREKHFSADYFIVQINILPIYTENKGFEEVLNIRARLNYSQPIIMLSFLKPHSLEFRIANFILLDPKSNVYLRLPFNIQQLYDEINKSDNFTDKEALHKYLSDIKYFNSLMHESKSQHTSSLIKKINQECLIKFNIRE